MHGCVTLCNILAIGVGMPKSTSLYSSTVACGNIKLCSASKIARGHDLTKFSPQRNFTFLKKGIQLSQRELPYKSDGVIVGNLKIIPKR